MLQRGITSKIEFSEPKLFFQGQPFFPRHFFIWKYSTCCVKGYGGTNHLHNLTYNEHYGKN